MRKVIRKVWWVWQSEEEERWLNEMAAKGMALVGVGFCRYEFEDCTPGSYHVRLELLKNSPTHEESRQYIRFLEDTGAEHIGSFLNWVYFRKKTEDGPFNLFSDLDSRIRQLSLIMRTLAVIGIMNLCIGIYNIILLATIGFSFNALGLFNVALALFCGLGWQKLNKKREKMKKDRQIFE